jgi:transcriptional regulator with XRE-family HTH domain
VTIHRSHRVDVEALYLRLDRERRTRRIKWRDIANGAGVSPSTLTRIGQGSTPDADALVSLLGWLGETDLAPYITTDAEPTTTP